MSGRGRGGVGHEQGRRGIEWVLSTGLVRGRTLGCRESAGRGRGRCGEGAGGGYEEGSLPLPATQDARPNSRATLLFVLCPLQQLPSLLYMHAMQLMLLQGCHCGWACSAPHAAAAPQTAE